MVFLEALIEQAGEVSLKYFRSDLAVTDKRRKGAAFDPVTRADRETEEFIRQRITGEYRGSLESSERNLAPKTAPVPLPG